MAGVDRVKEQILEQADIIEYVSQYVRLQKRAGRFFGLCPFHQEKTPSFSVNPTQGFFHCFGCGKGGNVIDFVMGVENLTYAEARRYLATKLGIEIKPFRGARKEHQEIDRYSVMDQATLFFAKCLQESPAALQYLASRQLSPEHIKHFGLGFAPDSWDRLLTALRARKIPEKVLAELGIVVYNQNNNSHYDRFRNRIMFPIRNTLGRVIAFGGRSMNPDEPAKYLNSNDTPLFNKSKVLYLLDRAKEVLTDRGAVIVEGYMDAISMHTRGLTQTVATLGTALTKEHISILRRYTKDSILLYDGDSAGIRAAMRGVELFFEAEQTVRVALLPEGIDPDDFLKERGADEMQRLLEQAEDGFAFYIKQVSRSHDLKTTQGKMDTVEASIPLLARIPDPLLRREGMVKLAELLEYDVIAVESAVQKKLKQGKYKLYSPPAEDSAPPSGQPVKDPYSVIKKSLIRLLAFHQGLLVPEELNSAHTIVLFSKEEWMEIRSLVQNIDEHSLFDSLILTLLNPPSGSNKGSIVSRLSLLFSSPPERETFLAVTEELPLPSKEADLYKMKEDVLKQLHNEQKKKIQLQIKKQAQEDPHKALQALNDLLLGTKKN